MNFKIFIYLLKILFIELQNKEVATQSMFILHIHFFLFKFSDFLKIN